MIRNRAKQRNARTSSSPAGASVPQTFLEHVRELQSRLFVTAVMFIAITGAAFPFFSGIVRLIVAPLGKDNSLVYLTPGGAFSFMMQVCMYVGVIGTLPVMIYHVYRFVMPAVQKVSLRKVLLYTISSLVLALVGIVFAYVVSLPAAIKFLTGFNFENINPMLTIDSYLSFVMTYLLAGALLFQLPLILLMIDSIKPQRPRKLMSYQGKMILFSYIAAAVISPTPDAINQTLLACPIVVMYQLGVMIIAIRHRIKQRQPQSARVSPQAQRQEVPRVAMRSPIEKVNVNQVATVAIKPSPPAIPQQSPRRPRPSIDGICAPTKYSVVHRPARPQPAPLVPARSTRRPLAASTAPRCSIDGVLPYPRRIAMSDRPAI